MSLVFNAPRDARPAARGTPKRAMLSKKSTPTRTEKKAVRSRIANKTKKSTISSVKPKEKTEQVESPEFVREAVVASQADNPTPNIAIQGPDHLADDTLYQYSTRHNLCLDILCSGYVQSYAEFFYLTHRPSDSLPKPKGEGNNEKLDEEQAIPRNIAGQAYIDDKDSVPVEGLEAVANNLRAAETARRAADPGGIFSAYSNLAQYFESLTDFDTAIYFHKKCAATAQDTGDLSREWEACNALGEDNEKVGDIEAAISFYERALELARKQGRETAVDDSREGDFEGFTKSQEQVKKAEQHLVLAYERYAEKAHEQGDHHSAMSFYRKCLSTSQSVQDESAEAEANYHLGLECDQLKDTDQAVKYFGRYLDLCKKLGDEEGEQRACSMLARSHRNQDDLESSAKFLEERRLLAIRTKNAEAEAAACMDIGMIANQRREYSEAAKFFARALEISGEIALPARDVDRIRVSLGIARGNQRLHDYVSASLNSSDSLQLYKWKIDEQLTEGLTDERESLERSS